MRAQQSLAAEPPTSASSWGFPELMRDGAVNRNWREGRRAAECAVAWCPPSQLSKSRRSHSCSGGEGGSHR